MDQKPDIQAYTDAVTEDRIAAAVAVTRRAVRLQVKRGFFPSGWYLSMQNAGLEPPVALFNFRGAA